MAEFDFSKVAGAAMVRETLAEPKVKPVDPDILNLAKTYLAGIEQNGTVLHAGRYSFKSEEMAAEFAAQLRRAGNFTEPKSTITVKVDPEGKGEGHVVGWYAGARRGKRANGS